MFAKTTVFFPSIFNSLLVESTCADAVAMCSRNSWLLKHKEYTHSHTAPSVYPSLLAKLQVKGGDEAGSRRLRDMITSVWEMRPSSGSVKRLPEGELDGSLFFISKGLVTAQTEELLLAAEM